MVPRQELTNAATVGLTTRAPRNIEMTTASFAKATLPFAHDSSRLLPVTPVQGGRQRPRRQNTGATSLSTRKPAFGHFRASCRDSEMPGRQRSRIGNDWFGTTWQNTILPDGSQSGSNSCGVQWKYDGRSTRYETSQGERGMGERIFRAIWRGSTAAGHSRPSSKPIR